MAYSIEFNKKKMLSKLLSHVNTKILSWLMPAATKIMIFVYDNQCSRIQWMNKFLLSQLFCFYGNDSHFTLSMLHCQHDCSLCIAIKIIQFVVSLWIFFFIITTRCQFHFHSLTESVIVLAIVIAMVLVVVCYNCS